MDSWPQELDRAFTKLWDTLHLDATVAVLPEQRLFAPDDHAERLDFSLVSLPQLTGGEGRASAELELGQTIGKGGMGVVVLARQSALDREVAVKLLRDDLRSPDKTRELLSEAWVTGAVEHPNVVPVHALGRDERGSPLLVMKRITGTSWGELIRNPGAHAEAFAGQPPLEWHLGVLMQICNAVHFAHDRGFIHRDLKPDNVMVGAFGEVVLLDWGLAVSTRESSGRFRLASQVNGVAGSPGYMAPEMVDRAIGPITERTDVYLLGAVLHEVITGLPRHRGASLMAVLLSAFKSDPFSYGPEVPEELAAIAHCAMSREPGDRYASADTLKKALSEWLRHKDSTELAHAARERMEELGHRLGAGKRDPIAIHKAFGEARFGFTQALRVWPENVAAKEGLAATIRAMIGYELDQGSLDAAAALLDELAEQPPDLATRLAELRKKSASDQSRYRALEELEREVDAGIGARARQRLLAAMAVVWGVVPFIVAWLVRSDTVAFTYPRYVTQSLALPAMVLVGLVLGRRSLLSNRIGRRIMAAILLLAATLVVHRVAALGLGIPPTTALIQELLLSGLATSFMAVTVEPRLGYGGLAYLLGLIAAVLRPEWVYEAHGVSNLLALTAAAYAWPTAPKRG